MNTTSLVIRLIREPETLFSEATGPLLPRLMAVTVGAGALFGGAVGVQHSWLQGLSSAVKLPLILLLPPLVAMPALAALAHTLGMRLPMRRASVAALACVARIAVFAAAIAPALWVFNTVVHGYQARVLSAVAALALSGLYGLGPLLAAPEGDAGPLALGRRGMVMVGTVALFGLVGAQTGWLLRPFVLHEHLPFVGLEFPESDVFTEVAHRISGSARPQREAP